MSPGHKKQVVAAAVRERVCSGRAGCRILRLSRSGYAYQAGLRSIRLQALVRRIHVLTAANPRYGYRRIAALLRQEGWRVGKRQVRRLRRMEGLRVPPTRRKLVRRGHSTGLPTKATHKNHVWTWDFIADATIRGGALRMLTVLDEHTRECHVLRADRALKSGDVIKLVKAAIRQHGAPQYIRSNSFSRLASLTSIMPNSRFHRWNVTSEMFFSLHSSVIERSPASASRNIRIFSSVLNFLPFISGSFLGPD